MLKRKTALFLAIISGFSVMVVELTASRIISPMLGNSIYTWTSIIGSILLGSAIGGWVGGKVIDRLNNALAIVFSLFFSSIFILFIPILAAFIRILPQWNIPLWLSASLSALLLLVIPAFFLGSVYPMILRMHISDTARIGTGSGTISAGWSIGSIFGTFITGFYFIGYFGSKTTIIIISVLLALSGYCLLSNRRHRLIYIVYCFLSASLFVLALRNDPSKEKVLFHKESSYYDIRVVDINLLFMGKKRILFLDADSHSVENLSDVPLDIYTNIYPVFSIFNKNIREIAVIGGGSLSLSSNFKSYYPQSSVITAEIDPAVTEIARHYFDASDDVADNTVNIDGRLFLEQSKKKYDVIFSDAYNSFISIPWYMATREFYGIAKSRLSPDGMFAINFISSKNGDSDDYFDSMLATFSSVFDNHIVFSFGSGDESVQNTILIGINSTNRPDTYQILSEISKMPNANYLSKHFDATAASPSAHAVVFTDDFAPTDRLMVPTMDKYFISATSLTRSMFYF